MLAPVLFLGLGSLAASAPVSVTQPRHTHFAVDTESGTPGDRTLVQTVYGQDEEDFRIDGDGRVWYGDGYARYLLNLDIPFDLFDGWIGDGGIALLTMKPTSLSLEISDGLMRKSHPFQFFSCTGNDQFTHNRPGHARCRDQG